MKTLLWQHLPCDEAQAAALAAALGLHPTIARLLCLRGFGDAERATRFLNPSLDHLHDPYLLADMHKAIPRLERAVAQREKIAIHGDYDVDGITSTVILRRALEMLGGDVMHFLPERMRDGYGLQPATIDRLHAQGVQLIVSVDCGIRAADAAQRARDLGVDLIITDHHEPEGTLPAALAVINPKRSDCPYPDKYLAGVGVALKVVQALCDRAGKRKWLPAFVKIAAIGTLADVVPLVGENRVIARLGLASLSRGPHAIGLRALTDRLHMDIQNVRWLFASIFLFICGVFWILTTYLTRGILRPLEDIRQAAMSLADGEPIVDVPQTGDHEIDELGQYIASLGSQRRASTVMQRPSELLRQSAHLKAQMRKAGDSPPAVSASDEEKRSDT
jgi:HAMP domain-containing protein